MKNLFRLVILALTSVVLTGCVKEEVEVSDILGKDYGKVDYKDAPSLVIKVVDKVNYRDNTPYTLYIQHNNEPVFAISQLCSKDFVVLHATGQYYVQVLINDRYHDPMMLIVGDQIAGNATNILEISCGQYGFQEQWFDHEHHGAIRHVENIPGFL